MSTIQNDTSKNSCFLCLAPYTPAEINDTNKTIELQCQHLFHINCLIEKTDRDENCPTCKSTFSQLTTSYDPKLDPFMSKKDFDAAIDQLEHLYPNDPNHKEAFVQVRDMFSAFDKIYSTFYSKKELNSSRAEKTTHLF